MTRHASLSTYFAAAYIHIIWFPFQL